MTAAAETYPHLAHLVDDEHDGTGEIEKALSEIDNWRQMFEAFKDTMPRLEISDHGEIIVYTQDGWLLISNRRPTDE